MMNFFVEHNLPYLVADHLTELVKKGVSRFSDRPEIQLQEDQVNEALVPHFQQSVEKLCRENKFSIMIDESNDRGDNKLLAVLVCMHDDVVQRVKTRILTLRTVGAKNSMSHLATICVGKAVKSLPLPVEDLVDVYFYFQKSMKCKETLRSFQEFTDTEPSKILKHCQTRWLSLEHCVSGSSQIGVMDSEIHRLLCSLLADEGNRGCLRHHEGRLHQSPSSARVQQIAVGWRARQFLDEHDVAPYTTEKFFRSTVVKVMLAKFLFGDRKLKAMGYLNPAFRMNVTLSHVHFFGAAFLSKERGCLNALEREAGDYLVILWKELPMAKVPVINVSMEAFWSDMEKVTTTAGEHRLTTLCNLSKIILTLPHSNADIQRVFSIVRKIQTNSRDNLGQEAYQENILAVQLNNPRACHLYLPDLDTLKAA
ncbi:hypothetical protein MAR_001207 [Mya arenaria]|uniref:HAT C-terminal dimerisation domain-containing protein n=1 Tax=Mya arenaria TaxID=6604 RepID=A0ABY7FER8_MYAAR|nr:hypothetical protein MAR_001207 [Mya arenaria]